MSSDYETVPGDDATASQRLHAWCASSTAGDWALFERRLERDGLTLAAVRARFAGAQPACEPPPWLDDARWLLDSMYPSGESMTSDRPFAPVWDGVVAAADTRLDSLVDVGRLLTPSAREDLRALLRDDLCALCAAPLYDLFVAGGRRFDQFVADVIDGDLRAGLGGKPVLLRLVATLARQWIDGMAEFLLRLRSDLPALADELGATGAVVGIEGGLSDRHRGGSSVLRVEFGDGTRVMYKPKDTRVDAQCHALIDRLNAEAPVTLRAARVLAGDGYGWAEFIDHVECSDVAECGTYFRRAGAWLAVLFVLAAGDMHQENIIAHGAHPVPIDLETILQERNSTNSDDSSAYLAARESIGESVLSVGLLPAYARTLSDDVYVVGGVASGWSNREQVVWHDVNTDAMRPTREVRVEAVTPNLPHVRGDYARLADHFEELVSGFRDYAEFLAGRGDLLDGFAGLVVRRVIRPTQFYELLLGRLRDDRKMADGALWSAQADFVARLADWSDPQDPLWPALRVERAALVQLDVPFFTTTTSAGLARAAERIGGLGDRQLDWQCDLIRQVSTFEAVELEARPPATHLLEEPVTPDEAVVAADVAIECIAAQAIRVDDGVAWIGLEWIADSDVAQLGVLGHDLYNGNCGIGLALAAHAKVSGRSDVAELARASLAQLRARLNGASAAHAARLLGIGGATGLGSVVYAMTTMSALLGDEALLADAHRAARLMTDELIAADKRFDVLGGAAGAILGLLRLHAASGEASVLDRAARCGDHLIAMRDTPGLIGMSHGSAGFAYALTALAAATGRADVAKAAVRHLEAAVEPDDDYWRSQWCHGAVGVGLAQAGMMRHGRSDAEALSAALVEADRVWPGHVDTLCCGALGSIELFREAGRALGREDLGTQASRRLAAVLRGRDAAGNYRWNRGETRFNLGLFRGLAGVAYTCLREIDPTLPNVLIWE